MPMYEDLTPDPLAALTGRLRLLRYTIRGFAMVLAAAIISVCLTAFTLFCAALLRFGIPILPGGHIPMGEERDVYLSAFRWGPWILLVGFVVGPFAFFAILKLVDEAARRVRRPADAMIAHFMAKLNEAPQPLSRVRSLARRVGVWALVAVIGIAGWFIGAAEFGTDPRPHSIADFLGHIPDAIYGAFFIVLMMAVAGVVIWALWAFGDLLLRGLVEPLGIAKSDIEDLERSARIYAEEAALRRWPPHEGTVLRLDTATSVLAGPAPRPRRRRERNLDIPWSGQRTSVEVLAATLFATAVLECRQRGLLECRVVNGRPYLQAKLPADVLPEGLAEVVLGHHREGLDTGRTVDGTLQATIASWLPYGDEDPHWRLIETALTDLLVASIIVETGAIDVERLQAVMATVPSDRSIASLVSGDATLFLKLVRESDRALRKRRTIETGDSLLAKLIGVVGNQARRSKHRLPEVAQRHAGPTPHVEDRP
jgi:hypothetical protein